MTIRSVWAVFFSATGATRKVTGAMAQQLAERLGVSAKTYDFTLPAGREHAPAFSEGELVIFGTPVYAGRVPNLLVKYIETIAGGGAMAVPIVVYGNRAFDDALMELRNLLETDGFHTLAGCTFLGEHSFGRSMAAGRPDEADLAIARGFADEIAQKLAGLSAGEIPSPVAVPGNNPVAPYFRPTDSKGAFIDIRKVKPVTDEELCIACGWCAERCPMGSIDFDDAKLVQGICIKCNACVKGCPMQAKRFDDPNYLFHRDDILTKYSFPRREPALFL